MAGTHAGAPGDPGNQSVLLDPARMVVPVTAVVRRQDEQGLVGEAGGADRVDQRAQAFIAVADCGQLRVRHPAVGVTAVVGIGEVHELDLRPLLDEVARRFGDDLLAEVSGAREEVDRSRLRDVFQLALAHERRRALAGVMSGVEDRRHADVPAFGLPRVPVQPVRIDVEPRQHRGVRGQRRRVPDRPRGEGVGPARHHRRVHRRANVHERVGPHAILADDDDVGDARPARRGAAAHAVGVGVSVGISVRRCWRVGDQRARGRRGRRYQCRAPAAGQPHQDAGQRDETEEGAAARKACPLPNPLPQTGEGTGSVSSASHPLLRSAAGEGRGEGRPCERRRALLQTGTGRKVSSASHPLLRSAAGEGRGEGRPCERTTRSPADGRGDRTVGGCQVREARLSPAYQDRDTAYPARS